MCRLPSPQPPPAAALRFQRQPAQPSGPLAVMGGLYCLLWSAERAEYERGRVLDRTRRSMTWFGCCLKCYRVDFIAVMTQVC